MRTSDLHDELVEAVLRAGAVSPGPLLPPGYDGDNADAVFVRERTIVEVKSVCEDHAAAAALERRLAPEFKRWIREAGAVVFGTVGTTWDEYPAWLQHKIEDKMAPSLRGQLRKANGQIRETQEALGWDASYGIVAFIIPNGFNVDPWMVGRVAWNQLIRRQGGFPYVDALTVVTVPVDDQAPSANPAIFLPMPRRNERVPGNLSSRIRDAWFQHYATKTGIPIRAREGTEAEFFRMQKPLNFKIDL